ncbi:divergent polysaccharide deacetylase family protein [Marinomonas sp. 2405UD68-3]|uniref:divergent polysaccharide deacetylase family protein n=1 Tax=Marinomonas sp. 2405UD68-3 TaxID=3391835 RepID=UPI0039C91E11
MYCNNKSPLKGVLTVLCVSLFFFDLSYAQSVIDNELDKVRQSDGAVEIDSLLKGPIVLPTAEKAFCLPSIFRFSSSVSKNDLCNTADEKTNLSVILQEDYLGPLLIEKATSSNKKAVPSLEQLTSDLNDEVLQERQPMVNEVLDQGSIKADDYLSSPPVKIAILIDDLGYNRKGMELSLALPNEVALAILPHTPFGKKTALISSQTGRVILLHAPMESINQHNLGPGGLYTSMTQEQVIKTLNDDLLSLPNVIGVNNHMGSLLTQKTDTMKWIMQVLQEKNLFFIDSVTSSKSVGWQEAVNSNIRTMKRDVFLDNKVTEKAIDTQFEKLLKIARKKGHALAIGHPYPATMKYLANRLRNLDELNVELVPLTELLDKKLATVE